MMRHIILRDERHGDDISTLTARRDGRGDLVLEGYDAGPSVASSWGSDEYEYAFVIPARHADRVLRWLQAQEGFPQLYRWLTDSDIPFRFESWP